MLQIYFFQLPGNQLNNSNSNKKKKKKLKNFQYKLLKYPLLLFSNNPLNELRN